QGGESMSRLIADALAASSIPVLLVGAHPWRPASVLESRDYAELELDTSSFVARHTMWQQALPEINAERMGDRAARFRNSNSEIRAAARLDRTQAQITNNGCLAPLEEQLEGACGAVTRQHSHHFATIVKPKRGPDDLILPRELHKQVMEVA